ncbi:uncharacterized protein LOC112048527 isoform X2 [Bicyclus anynana]|uniref:Uncharacterized protein LOC112048527 isoform X2 n=1 Tax=Bicyclus anynana TaxID=110368 RepID=A0A6J1N9V0_BICAN|nr:uncharacterized protein LOC112048527 isoform X2 [Bicyclus anynana]
MKGLAKHILLAFIAAMFLYQKPIAQAETEYRKRDKKATFMDSESQDFGPPVIESVKTTYRENSNQGKIQVTVCANPPPQTAEWRMRNLRLNVPGRLEFYAAEVSRMAKLHCYMYILKIDNVGVQDQITYILKITNDRGSKFESISFNNTNNPLRVTPQVLLIITATLFVSACVLTICLTLKGLASEADSEENVEMAGLDRLPSLPVSGPEYLQERRVLETHM